MLEPVSPFTDYYSLNVAYWPSEPIQVEIVGPGFDASDLKRGDESPHESFELDREHDRYLQHLVISNGRYTASWLRRLEKCGRMLSGRRAASLPQEEVRELAREALRANGEALLLEHEAGYPPIPRRLIEAVVHQTKTLPHSLEALDLPGEPLIVSMSFVTVEQRAVYWDMVWPHRKYAPPMRSTPRRF
jgi:hypothetical protein